MPNLVGIGLSQVPTNSMLGGLAYQDPEHASIKDLDLKNLSQINSEIIGTVTDIFVYDTSKDSDGGAWRYRTQQTSWYNEKLGTETRGTRKEFPAVAVISTDGPSIFIHDGDDPNLPLWMKFTIPSYSPGGNWQYETAGIAHASFYSSTSYACHMLNGQLVVISEGSGYHSGWMINFISEEMMDMVRYGNATNQFYRLQGPISERNSTTSIQIAERYGNSEPDPLIIGRVVGGSGQDVSMTVTPDAPIDPDTGLPTPTIAIASQLGVTVIDKGKVKYLEPESAPAYLNNKTFYQVDFTSDNHIVLTDRQTTSGYSNVIYLPNYNFSKNLSDTYSSLDGSYNYTWDGQIRAGAGTVGFYNYQDTGVDHKQLTTTSDSFVFANTDNTRATMDGFIKVGNYPNQLMINRVTTTYNTGWMFGKCRLASLMSFDDTNLTNGQTEPDRSITDVSLVANGEIGKYKVAEGADLVGFAGSGTANYLTQAYNSNLDIGTGDFSVSGWLYTTNVGGGQYIFDRSDTYNSSRNWQLWVAADLKYMTMYINGGLVLTSGNNAYPNNKWFHFTVVRRHKEIEMYLNGLLVNRASIDSYSVATSSNQPLKILYNCNPNTRLALFRLSTTAMSQANARKMYQDEKPLFEKNAKAGIYGSGARFVTALGYDDVEDTLHVGTSAGRSDFRGLARINNTTTAVTTAISASNGFVAEQ